MPGPRLAASELLDRRIEERLSPGPPGRHAVLPALGLRVVAASGVKATMLTRSERTRTASDEPDLKRILEALELLADALTTPAIDAPPEADELDEGDGQQQSERSDQEGA